ncbi:UDP-glucuronic acid decarboxylase 4 [Striga hermonthica]|uniref:UDP-glucuronate decarboxylase n=1 Tax=Striga hermonthica TaxID=68872 RepID=A0A9N7N9V6_STRHE|nr:UDP-glucuronic acid decarboxylase 4 [Striga hermonthica]
MLAFAKRIGARFLLTSTSEVYGDPLEHPQKETYWGHVNPIGVRSCYDEGKRTAATLTMDYHRGADVEVRIARILNTCGPRMCLDDGRVVSNFVSQVVKETIDPSATIEFKPNTADDRHKRKPDITKAKELLKLGAKDFPTRRVASHATAICLSTDEKSPSSTPSSTSTAYLLPASAAGSGGGGAAIDRYNPILRDPNRTPKPPPPYNSRSDPPAIPKSRKIAHIKNRKIQQLKENENDKLTGGSLVRRSWKCMNPGDFISPPGSTRYLLREKIVHAALSLSDFDRSSPVNDIPKDVEKMEDLLFAEKQSCPSLPHAPEQVVVLRVSLHCRGCEKKLRKHLSRMEGVTSYNIDFAAKKVTVNGKITPSDVLTSICKVKNAQLWSPTLSSSSV